jgi:hypothetical protein
LANRKGTLLLRPDGGTWNKSNHARRFIEAVKAAGLDPTVVSIYALRHSSIVRQLLANGRSVLSRRCTTPAWR